MSANDFISKWKEALAKLEREDGEAKAKGTIIGRYISEPIGDGYAYYRITRELKNNVVIKRIYDEGLDNYVIPYWGDTARIDKEYALTNLRCRDNWVPMFKAKEENYDIPF